MGLSLPRPRIHADDRTETCGKTGMTVSDAAPDGSVPTDAEPGRPIPTVKKRLQEAP
jgi:hypothetical protein